ncbi:uncharacterized protein N7496_011730 [Penicillium cataractarum]|uniref:Uncharacterized protein n=1 Tax=Penicillium cataractarum TaxID=2100454 RepID=A0A9W9RFI4_9EURO|nr:uncharacterized protein N7496_011730 [Penicillium cataractarum]KAJ5359317.1 hypothetical protein N7496_011730 [Penicillium cataractarum]
MGQRHNRRRTRPRSSKRRNSFDQDSPELSNIHPPLALPSTIWSPHTPVPPPAALHYTPSAACISPGSPVSAAPAPTWHYGFTAWPIRENVPQRREASIGLEARQCRLFGGEPGDDLNLCYRMLEYFDGLDYIDPLRNSTPGD